VTIDTARLCRILSRAVDAMDHTWTALRRRSITPCQARGEDRTLHLDRDAYGSKKKIADCRRRSKNRAEEAKTRAGLAALFKQQLVANIQILKDNGVAFTEIQ